MKLFLSVLVVFLVSGGIGTGKAFAHFQTILPSTEVVSSSDSRKIDLRLVFTHPMEQGPAMEMGQPRQFGVVVGGDAGSKKDLLEALKVEKTDGKTSYSASYDIKRPGDHVFFVEPAPYWEPAEEKMIVHYTKVVVNALGEEGSWDLPVGFPVEIKPLTRPYGLRTGNIFQGIVEKDGKPVPYAEVEVEYWNEGKKVSIPSDPYITQVIKADSNGVFTYAMPKAGWWGFAALIDGDEKMKNPDGQLVDVELGALIWVNTKDM